MRNHARDGQRSIRALIALVVVVPLVSLLCLWGYAADITLSSAVQEHNFSADNNAFGGWAQTLSTQLAQERAQSFLWLSTGRRSSEGPMLAQQKATDNAVAAFRHAVSSSSGILASARPALSSFYAALSGLPRLRAAIESGDMSALAAFTAYNNIVDAQFRLYGDLIAVNDYSLYEQATASVEAGRAAEMVGRELTLISGALATNGQMSKAERILFAKTSAQQHLLSTDALQQLNPALGAGYRRAYSSAAYKNFVATENRIIASIGSRRPIPVDSLAFAATSGTLPKEFQAAEAQDRVALAKLGTSQGNKLILEVVLAGGLGLLAVILSLFLMLRTGRRISTELTRLQRAAQELANERLPRVVERLSQGEDVDVASEAAPLALGRVAEISRVSEAISSVQRTAVEAAAGQARLRRGVSQVFRNLAWRSQSLLHRQLSLLDAMERKSTEPEALDELFRLDHLTTRMRRHAEGLIILSGAAPARGWREPVPIMDVLRGAIGEVEDYKRVAVFCDSEDAVVGAAVADVIHLLAELIENATFYSPASTEVAVKAARVANGFVIEIEDRGIGISEEELAVVNDRLANPPEFDPGSTDQLGLFVVARLAARHRIKVTARPSPYGGTGAIVFLPHAIVVARGRADGALDRAVPGWLRLPPGAGPEVAIEQGSAHANGGTSATEEARQPSSWFEPSAEDPFGSAHGAPSPVPAAPVPPGDVLPGSVLPGDVLPGDVLPGSVLPGDVLPGSVLPGDVPSGSVQPSDVLPGSVLPGDVPSGDVPSGSVPPGDVPPSPVVLTPMPSSTVPTWTMPASVLPTAEPAQDTSQPDAATPELPRRVRQASLAPQLRSDPLAATNEASAPDGIGERSASGSRALVDALQSGWQRGLADAGQDDDAWTPARGPEQATPPEDREDT